MSFPIAEIITSAVIEERLQYLADHPSHLNWMLSPFVAHRGIARLVDPKYIEQCVNYIKSSRPMVRPVYETDMNKLPSIVVSSFQGEGQMFIGDYGGQHMAEQHRPSSILTFDSISIEKNIVTTTNNQGVDEVVWPGLYFKSGQHSSVINSLYKQDNLVVLQLKDDLPSGLPLQKCQIMTGSDQTWYMINSSIDTVKANVTLTTAGDHAIHRLMTVVLRYCLKSGRMLFDNYGMQVATFSQQPAMLADDTQLIWQTAFMIDAKITDHWIVGEGGLIGAPMQVEMTADSTEEGQSSVDLDTNNWD